VLIGPRVSLFPALWCELGWRIGQVGMPIFCYPRQLHATRGGRLTVVLAAMNEFRSVEVRFEVEDVMLIAEQLYEQAQQLEKIHITSHEEEP